MYRSCVCIRVGLGRGEGRGGRVPPFLHSEYKHVLLLSIHWMGSGDERCMRNEMSRMRCNIDGGLAKKTVSDWYA